MTQGCIPSVARCSSEGCPVFCPTGATAPRFVPPSTAHSFRGYGRRFEARQLSGMCGLSGNRESLGLMVHIELTRKGRNTGARTTLSMADLSVYFYVNDRSTGPHDDCSTTYLNRSSSDSTQRLLTTYPCSPPPHTRRSRHMIPSADRVTFLHQM